MGAMDDLFSASDLDDGLSGDLHVAAHADFMLESCDGGTVLGFEEPEVEFEDIFVERFCQKFVLVSEVGDARLQIDFLAVESCEEVLKFLALFGMRLFRGGDLRYQLFEILHQIQLAIFEGYDGLFSGLNFMGKGRVFFILTGLELLLSVAGDGIPFGSRLHFEGFSLDLDFPRADLCQVELGGGVRDLPFASLALLGQMCELRLEASKALVAVLQGEQLFDHIRALPNDDRPA